MAILRELKEAIRESISIHVEFSGRPRKIVYRELTPDMIAAASRKKEKLRQAEVKAYQRVMLTFLGFPIVMILLHPILPDVLNGLLMLVFPCVFTYFVVYVGVETNRHRYFRCPRCGSIFRDFHKIFPDKDRCRVCGLDLSLRAIGQNQDLESP